MTRTVVVTGASTGIGWAIVESLTARGMHVAATVRTDADAERLRATFGDRVTPLLADVTDPASLHRAAEVVRAKLGNRTLAGLVNNAGIALGGPLLAQPMAEVRQVFEVNVFGLLEATRAFAPLLGTEPGREGPPGRVVNIGSVSGWMALPFVGTYSATKHAVKALTEALRGELQLFGIDVTVVEPGPVVTPIWAKARAQDQTRYDGTPYAGPLTAFRRLMDQSADRGLPASAIGEAVVEQLTASAPPARRVMVRGRFLQFTIPRLLPARMTDRFFGKLLELRRP